MQSTNNRNLEQLVQHTILNLKAAADALGYEFDETVYHLENLLELEMEKNRQKEEAAFIQSAHESGFTVRAYDPTTKTVTEYKPEVAA